MGSWVHTDCMCRTFNGGSFRYDKKEVETLRYSRKRLLKKIYKYCDKIRDNLKLDFVITPKFKDELIYKTIWKYNDDITILIYGDKEDYNFDKKYNLAIEDMWYNSDIYFFSGICMITTSFDREILIYDSMKKEHRE